jgi:uncharacterized protein
MLGTLNNHEMEDLLFRNVTGRIGCREGDRIYIVPVSYAYNEKYVIAHSEEGLKIRMMRKNPNVCFEVDEIGDLGNWKSVVGSGRFEEILDEKEKYYAMKFLVSRLMHLKVSQTARLPQLVGDEIEEMPVASPMRSVVYRIRIECLTGRFERS